SASSKLPADLHENEFARECLVRFGEPIAGGSFGTYRLWLSQNSVTNWIQRPILSSEDVDGTFVYGSWRVIYNMGARYSIASPYLQGPRSPVSDVCNYRLNMPADDLFLGTSRFEKINAPGNGPF